MYRVDHGYTWTEHQTAREAFKAAYHAARLEYRISHNMIPAMWRITKDGRAISPGRFNVK
jgi:hypothetical protein